LHAATKDESDDSKDSFYEEVEQVFDHFPKYQTKIFLGDFNEKWGERIFSNRQLGMRIYIRIVMTMVLNSKLCHMKKSSFQLDDISAPKRS
jgi:hypothetical protein